MHGADNVKMGTGSLQKVKRPEWGVEHPLVPSVKISYIFRHWSAILRESLRPQEEKPSTLIKVRIAVIGIIKTLKF
jgi:hypothetical protein